MMIMLTIMMVMMKMALVMKDDINSRNCSKILVLDWLMIPQYFSPSFYHINDIDDTSAFH